MPVVVAVRVPVADTHGGSYSGSRSVSGESGGGYGSASGSYNRSYEGSHGGSADVSGARGAAYGPNGAAAGSSRDVSATGPKGQTYNSQEERGAAAGPNGAVAGGSRSTSRHGRLRPNLLRPARARWQPVPTASPPPARITAPQPTATAHTALPTDAGYGMPAAGTGSTAYAGYHQTEAVSGSVYAARGAAVRSFVQRLRHVRGRLACGQSGRVGSGGLESRLRVDAGHLARGRCVARLGRRRSAGRLQLWQQRYLPGQPGLLWQPTGRHGRAVLSAGFDAGSKCSRAGRESR